MSIRHAFKPQADDDAVCCCGKSKYAHIEACSACNGHGANLMSDNRNWIPCQECEGYGVKKDGLMVGERIDFRKATP